MARFLLCLSLALFVAPAWAADDFDAFFDGLRTFQAEFEQVVRDAQGNELQRSRGRFSIARPGRFRWDYEQPYRQLLLGDGERLWTYDPDLEQATVRPQQEALAGTPALLLSGGEHPRKLFEVSKEGGAYLLTPRKKGDQPFASLRLSFDKGVLTRMEFRDELGQTTEILFHHARRNVRLEPGLFRFEPPVGTDVIEDVRN